MVSAAFKYVPQPTATTFAFLLSLSFFYDYILVDSVHMGTLCCTLNIVNDVRTWAGEEGGKYVQYITV